MHCAAAIGRNGKTEPDAAFDAHRENGGNDNNEKIKVRATGQTDNAATHRRLVTKRCAYFSECKPTVLPSVSAIMAIKPCSPMGNFSCNTLPPFSATLPCSVAQSSQPK